MPAHFPVSPPHSTEAERTVLGALLIDGDAIVNVTPQLTARDFYDPVHRAIFAAIEKLVEEGTALDFVTLSDRLKASGTLEKVGGAPFLTQLTADVPTASHISYHAAIVREKSRRRRLAEIGSKIASLAQEEKHTADELTEMAEREFLSLTHQKTDTEPTRLGDMRTERYEHYVQLFESDDPAQFLGIRTGFTDLDDKITGLASGELIVLAGRPGMGKTALALNIARHAAVEQGKVVAVLSLEMSKESLFDRLFAASLGIPSWKLTQGMLTEKQFEQMGPVFDQFANYPLYVSDDPNSDLVNIRSTARRFQMRYGLDLLIVDYLQLIEVTDRLAGENATQRTTWISKSLKRLARELHCPVLALSQLSRECDRRPDRRPLLSDLRDSGSIEQDADKVLMIYREGEKMEDCEDPNATDLYIRKNRNGPTGSVSLTFEKETMTFRQAALSSTF